MRWLWQKRPSGEILLRTLSIEELREEMNDLAAKMQDLVNNGGMSTLEYQALEQEWFQLFSQACAHALV